MGNIFSFGGSIPFPIKRSGQAEIVRFSTSIKLLFLSLFFTLAFQSIAQLTYKEHLEIPLSKNDAEFKILPCSTSGLVLYRTRDGQPTNLEVVFLDTAFQQRWGGLIQVEPKYQLVNHTVSDEKAYFLFTNKLFSDIHFLVFEVNLESGQYIRYAIRNYVPFYSTSFEVTKKGLLVGGYFAGRIPVVLFFDFFTLKSKILPGLFNEAGELVQIKKEPSGNFNVVINARNIARQRALWIKRYTADGDLLQNEILNPAENSSLLLGRVLTPKENEHLVAGVYGQRNSDYSRGIFLAQLTDGATEPIYFPFADLENFFKYMKAKREKRVKERIQRKKIKGKKIRFQYRFLVHEFVEYDDEYILLGEAFYPRYRSVDRGIYGVGPSQSALIFDGYQYTHAIIIGFNKQGKLIWDNSFEINDVRTFTLEQFVKMDLQEDKIVLLYLFENKIRSKIIQNNAVLEGKSFSDVVNNGGSYEDQQVGKLEYWYNGHFLASGVQSVGRTSIGRQARQIFVVNKIRFE